MPCKERTHGGAGTYFLWEKVSPTEGSPMRLTQTEPLGSGGGTESGVLLLRRGISWDHTGPISRVCPCADFLVLFYLHD